MERIIFVPWERVSLVIPEKQDLEIMKYDYEKNIS